MDRLASTVSIFEKNAKSGNVYSKMLYYTSEIYSTSFSLKMTQMGKIFKNSHISKIQPNLETKRIIGYLLYASAIFAYIWKSNLFESLFFNHCEKIKFVKSVLIIISNAIYARIENSWSN